MFNSARVLVTGVGSGTGQGILTALSNWNHKNRIYASDSDPDAAGLFLTKRRIVLPKLETEQGIADLVKFVQKEQIDIVMPGNEFDVLALAKQREIIDASLNTVIVVSARQIIELTNDKWNTYEYLKSRGVVVPDTLLANQETNLNEVSQNLKFPWIIKPRNGTASMNVRKVNSIEDAKQALIQTPRAMIQEYLSPTKLRGGKNVEFTCGLFRDLDGEIHGPIIGERVLRNGTSWIVKFLKNCEVSDYVLQIANNIDFYGPLNIQLILTKSGPKLLEVNCRFSGTTGIRSYFGFNEPKMAINNFLFGKKIEVPPLKGGLVLRYIENVVVEKS